LNHLVKVRVEVVKQEEVVRLAAAEKEDGGPVELPVGGIVRPGTKLGLGSGAKDERNRYK
jgi:hypothetical protein